MVEIWVVTFPVSRHLISVGQKWLDADETARLTQITSPIAQDRFVACRTVLRTVLSHKMQCGPTDFRWKYGASGKPELPGAPWGFNISHSGDFGLVAVASSAYIGVDIEGLSDRRNLNAIARHVFHPDELAVLEAVQADKRARFFYDIWVRKEAVTKWLGDSIFQVKQISVLGALSSAAQVVVDGRGAAWVLPLRVSSRYAAAVAIDAAGVPECPTPAIREWSDSLLPTTVGY